jgi:SAM-dependent methyltransferase/uncharacterized protein YbaR (Trm112 family)
MVELDPWLSDNLICPRDHQKIRSEASILICPFGHQYPVVLGIPIMLLPEIKQTHDAAKRSLKQAANRVWWNTARQHSASDDAVDSFVQREIAATNGIMYKSLIDKLITYPIPALRLHINSGGYFLDIGCNWGRWCIAASKLGYHSVGIDPSLDAILAAYRVARQLGVFARYVVADARYLPFSDNTFDCTFSYGVLQHFEKTDACIAFNEMKRVVKVGGLSMVQMPNALGVRSLYQQLRRGFRQPRDFEVRYWTISELKSTFERLFSHPRISADGYFTLNSQVSDIPLMPRRYRLVIFLSEILRKSSLKIPLLTYLADSLCITAERSHK